MVATVASRQQRDLHTSVGPAPRAWVTNRSLPDPRWRHRGPEGAAWKGHLDLQPAGPPRGGPCPSALSPRGLWPQAAGASGCPASRSPTPARSPPARAACSAATDPPGPRGPLRLPPLPSPVRPPSPPQLPRDKAHSPGRRQSWGPSAAPTSEAVAMGSAAATAGAAALGTERAAGPRAERRGPRRRGPAPTLRVQPGELRPRARPGHHPGPRRGPGPGPEPCSHLSAPLSARCGRESPRACAGLRQGPRAPGPGAAGLTCSRCVRAQEHACRPPAPASLCWKSRRVDASGMGGGGLFRLTERRPGIL